MPPRRRRVAAARSAIASSTGCTLVGELEITCRISLIAVCFASASLVSLKRRTLSMAMAAWSANVWTSAISFSVNARTSIRCSAIAPIAWPSRINGTASVVWWPIRRCISRPCGKSSSDTAARSGTWIMQRSTIARPITRPRVSGTTSPTAFAVLPNPATKRMFDPSTSTITDCAALAKLERPLGDGVQHRLHVGRRIRDHPQNLADRRLLFERNS